MVAGLQWVIFTCRVLRQFQNFIANSKVSTSWKQGNGAALQLPQTTSGSGHRSTAYRSGDCLLQSIATRNYYAAVAYLKVSKTVLLCSPQAVCGKKDAQAAR
jgi:hypothetical protein